MQKVAALIRDHQNINDTDFFGYSPLHYAVKRGRVSIVSLFIKAKALLNQVSTQHGNTPLLLAIETGHKKNCFPFINCWCRCSNKKPYRV
ncbi:MAG: ankyrin repeat domain-containing protein [Candidatus Cardinium sp.]|nr:ankyrin repeat domain-containing protein [Candidatus Cardinium sp.]